MQALCIPIKGAVSGVLPVRYYCKVKLIDWRRADDPFVEHYKWSKDCEFLKVCYVPESKDISVNRSNPFFGAQRVIKASAPPPPTSSLDHRSRLR